MTLEQMREKWYNTLKYNPYKVASATLQTPAGLADSLRRTSDMAHNTSNVPARDNSTKLCPKCKQEKLLTQFSKDSSRSSGVSSYCKECRRQWSKANSEYLTQKATEWQRNNRERAAANVRAWEQNNPEKKDEYRERTLARYPDRAAARQAVRSAVYLGKFPPAWTMVCEHCQEAQAKEYHHHRGYAQEFKLDVVALCSHCHGKEHRLPL